MTRDELYGHVADVLAAPLSNSRTVQALLSRANGWSLEDVLVPALAVAREQTNRKIAELERALDESEQDYWRLEDEMRELQDRIKHLARKWRPRGQPARKF